MPGFTNAIKKHYKPHFDSLIQDIRNRRDRDFFQPTGTQIFAGEQGSGKTISAVKITTAILNRYPKAILVSNLEITKLQAVKFRDSRDLLEKLPQIKPTKEYILFSTVRELESVLTLVNNEKYGVVYVIDEIHTYFNSKDSKEMPMWVFQQISQQRKQRKCIIGTSQLFMRVSKPFREQCDNVIVCNTIAGVLTFQRPYTGASIGADYDGKLTGARSGRTGFFWHTEKIRNFYDTYQVINSGSVEFEQLVKPDKIKKSFGFGKGVKTS